MTELLAALDGLGIEYEVIENTVRTTVVVKHGNKWIEIKFNLDNSYDTFGIY